MTRTRSYFLLLVVIASLLTYHGHAQQLPSQRSVAIEALLSAYPDQFDLNEQNDLVWRDGSAIDWGVTNQSPKQSKSTKNVSLYDQFSQIYSTIDQERLELPTDDPGRLRNEHFFKKMYGDCTKVSLQRNLATIIWLPQTAPQRIQVTTVNGVHLALHRASSEIEKLSAPLKAAAKNLQGSFVCRTIKGTSATSMHAYGAAIDFHSSAGGYWRWSGISQSMANRDKMPREIIRILENEGFIWGGRWYHMDSIHFEYRPELIIFSRAWNSRIERYLQKKPM